MIPLISWRNIWRNTTRSLVVMTAIALGIWAAIFLNGFVTGMSQSYISNAIQHITSHIQIHHPEFIAEKEAKYFLSRYAEMEGRLQQNDSVEAYSFRTIVPAMISSPRSTRGIELQGVDPAREAATTGLDGTLLRGEYFSGENKNRILIGEEVADELDVDAGSKVVLTFQDLEGNITAAAYRISGIFETGNKQYDETTAVVPRSELIKHLVAGDQAEPLVHEAAILLRDAEMIEGFQSSLEKDFPSALVENYRQLSPELELYETQLSSISLIYLVIIMFALIFGIVNTMLMAVLERIKELGMLMAIGMNRRRVFFMIVLEAIMLAAAAAPFGLLLGFLTIRYLGKYGINLSAYSETLQQYGISEIVYFDLDPALYWKVALAVAITAVIASIYPAIKAVRLKPVEAIRKI